MAAIKTKVRFILIQGGEQLFSFVKSRGWNEITDYEVKLGQGLATALTAILLDAIGYVEGAGAQSASVVNNLLHIGATIPMIVLLIMLFILLNYDMDKQYKKYKVQLEAKRSTSIN